MPVFHDCQRCTACCRWPGQVRLDDAEIARLSEFLALPEAEFIARHTRLRSDRRGLVLRDKANGECEFLDDAGRCSVQTVKPQQCRDFPNLWRYPGAEKFCHAVPHEVDETEYLRLVSAATGRTVAEVLKILPPLQSRNCKS
ncbi:MAG: hypothetical protein RL380_545 [Verrucomicrobiota bacterium]